MNDETKQRLELLKTARQQLSNQYIKDRAAAYTQWVADSDRVWQETGMKLPFPPPPPMPTETDVVAYALALYNAQNPPLAAAPGPTAPAPTAPPVEELPPVPASVPKVEIAAAPETTNNTEPTAAVEPAAEIPAAVPNAETTAPAVMPDITAPVVPPVAAPTFVSAGPADLDKAKTAIAEIFNAPAADPIAMTSSTPTPSVLPLIKSMLKKGMLPSWVRPDDAGIKE